MTNTFFYTLLKGRKGRMSDDNVSYFLKRYAKSAHELCSEVPLRMHAHLFRHTRAMHLYRRASRFLTSKTSWDMSASTRPIFMLLPILP